MDAVLHRGPFLKKISLETFFKKQSRRPLPNEGRRLFIPDGILRFRIPRLGKRDEFLLEKGFGKVRLILR